MSITSYAQNFEDVMLWRALGHVPNGFYIDVGAQHPVVDSISRAFYEHGWRGLHVEATPAYANLLRQDRPDETVIQAAVDDKHGTITFFEIQETGISTGDADIAESHKARGFKVLEITVPCITLFDIFSHVESKDIHWLKIDVEGMEQKVLQSWGKSKAKPWIVIVESTLPLTQIENQQSWENLLIDRGYSHVYFDGLNRYYLSPDQQQLTTAFLSGPNVFDGFTLHGGASAPFCAAINEKHRQAEQTLQHQVALLNQEKADSIQHFDTALQKMSAQLRATQEEEQRAKAAITEEASKHATLERELQREIETLQTQQKQAIQESENRERTATVVLELAGVKAMQVCAELARSLAQEQLELKNRHADREQTLLDRLKAEQQRYRELQHDTSKQVNGQYDQGSQKQQEIENLLRTQLDREKAITEKLETVRAQITLQNTELARAHVAQQNHLSHQYTEKERALRQRLEAEQAHRLQLLQDNSAREQALREQHRQAQQAAQNFLQSQVERERDAATQLLALQQKSTQENTELSRALVKQQTELNSLSISRQQALYDQVHNAQQEVEKLLRAQMQREQAIAEKLDAVRTKAAQDCKDLMRVLTEQQALLHNQHIAHEQAQREIENLRRDHVLREQEISRQLSDDQQRAAQEKSALQQVHAEEIIELSRQHAQNEAVLTHKHEQTRHHLQTLQVASEKRQQELIKQLQAVKLQAELYTAQLLREHSEQELQLRGQLTQREATLAQQLEEQRQTLLCVQIDSAHLKQSQDSEIANLQKETQALRRTQQQAQQHQLALTNKLEQHARLLDACALLKTQLLAEVQSEQQASRQLSQTLQEVQRNLEVTRASLSWRMTAPLRNLATFFTAIKNQSTPSVNFSGTTTHETETQAVAKPSSLTDNHIIDRPIHLQLEQIKTLSNMPTTASTLPELLAYNDQDFVQCAYQSILGREPDSEGMAYYLSRLRTGYSKMRIVAQLRFSNEGRKTAAQLTGLDTAIQHYQKEKLPLIGWLFRSFNRSDGNSPTERSLRSIENHLSVLDAHSKQRFDQIEELVTGSNKLILQQAQLIKQEIDGKENIKKSKTTAALSFEAAEIDNLKQLSPTARNIYIQLKTSSIKYVEKAAKCEF